jgi:hypothetical protein
LNACEPTILARPERDRDEDERHEDKNAHNEAATKRASAT